MPVTWVLVEEGRDREIPSDGSLVSQPSCKGNGEFLIRSKSNQEGDSNVRPWSTHVPNMHAYMLTSSHPDKSSTLNHPADKEKCIRGGILEGSEHPFCPDQILRTTLMSMGVPISKILL